MSTNSPRVSRSSSKSYLDSMRSLDSRVGRRSRRAIVLLLLGLAPLVPPPCIHASQPAALFPTRDQRILEDLERRSFQYFWEQAGADTGLVLDRTRTDGAPADENHRTVASIAAT